MAHEVVSLLEIMTDKGVSGTHSAELSRLKSLLRRHGEELVPVAFSVLLDRLQANNAKVSGRAARRRSPFVARCPRCRRPPARGGAAAPWRGAIG
jgi:hypothetical protein